MSLRLVAKIGLLAAVCGVNLLSLPLALLRPVRRWRPRPLHRLFLLAPFATGDRSGCAKAVGDFVVMLSRRHPVRVVAMTDVAPASAVRRGLGTLMTWALPFQRQNRPLIAGAAPLADWFAEADAVVLETFECATAVFFGCPPGPMLILRDHEVMLRKIAMERDAAHGVQRWLHALRLVSCLMLSWGVYRRMDHIVTLNDEERDAIVGWFPGLADRTSTLTLPFEPPPATALPIAPDGRQLLMVANFYHGPNVDGLRWFLAECAGLLEPGFTLHLCGLDGPLDGLALDGHGIEVRRHGFVPDVAAAVPEAAIAVAPIVSGGGVRIKNLLLASLGRVVVTTPLGNQGIGFVDGEDAVIAANGTVMATRLNQLARRPADLARIAANGRGMVATRFGSDAVYQQFVRDVLQPDQERS